MRFKDYDYLTKEIQPTPSHHFVKLLETKNQLFKVLTQNVDGLHSKSGIPDDKVINAHGTGGEAQCAICKSQHDFNEFESALRAGTPIFCPKCL